ASQRAVAVRLTLGTGVRWCAEAVPSRPGDDRVDRFSGSGAPPGFCPPPPRARLATRPVGFSPAMVPLPRPPLVAGPAPARGAPLGPEFQVNTYPTGSQLRPKVSADASGRFVVVWESGYYGTGPDGSSSGIAARRFDGAGTPAGPEFVVNTYTTGPQSYPS